MWMCGCVRVDVCVRVCLGSVCVCVGGVGVGVVGVWAGVSVSACHFIQ